MIPDQKSKFQESINDTKLTSSNLDIHPIRIFIGTSANGEDAVAEMVYEYSLRKNTDAELDITWMRQTKDTSSLVGRMANAELVYSILWL
jgi:hypothetical protein